MAEQNDVKNAENPENKTPDIPKAIGAPEAKPTKGQTVMKYIVGFIVAAATAVGGYMFGKHSRSDDSDSTEEADSEESEG